MMRAATICARSLLCVSLLILIPPAVAGGAAALPHGVPDREEALADKQAGSLTLEMLERMALENNPTLVQAEAAVREAEGRRIQAGLYPNPDVGYAGEEIAFRNPARTSEHMVVVEQTIVTANKLGHGREIFAHEQAQAEARARAQRQRVLNAVRILYYQALAAEEMVSLRSRLADLAREATDVTGQLVNVGQADEPDSLEAEIGAQRAELALQVARDNRRFVWRRLAAVAGEAELEPRPLEGSPEASIPELDWDSSLAILLRDSPEVEVARAGVMRAEAVHRRARADVVPDLVLQSGIGYNFDRFELGPDAVGMEAFIVAMVEIPLFDRNQGNILAANAATERAAREVRRVELSLQVRLADVFTEYRNNRTLVEAYRRDVIPRAEEAVDLYQTRFEQMAAAYPQVLIAQRSLFQARAEYVAALATLWRSVVTIRGLLLVDGLSAAVGGL